MIHSHHVATKEAMGKSHHRSIVPFRIVQNLDEPCLAKFCNRRKKSTSLGMFMKTIKEKRFQKAKFWKVIYAILKCHLPRGKSQFWIFGIRWSFQVWNVIGFIGVVMKPNGIIRFSSNRIVFAMDEQIKSVVDVCVWSCFNILLFESLFLFVL